MCPGNMYAVRAIVSVIAEPGNVNGLGAAEPGQRNALGRYEGEFMNGLKHGRGKYTWKTGEFFEGSFYKDFRHGDGVYCWPSEHKFIGKFYLNRKEGYGLHMFPNGSRFQGLYHADQRFGPGVLTYPDGRQDVGLWHNERLLRFCTTVEEGCFTLKDFPEYAAFMDTSITTEPCVRWSHKRHKQLKTLFSDDSYVLPSGIELFSTDGDHLPLPPKRRKDLDQHFFGDQWEPDVNLCQGYERDPLSTLPLEARMQAHIFKHRLQCKNQNWDIEAVLSLSRRGFGAKGRLEVSSEQLILHASRGDHRAVSQILRSGLVHPDVADALKHTALIAATTNCCNDVIDVLLDMGADIDKLNGENMSALAVCHILYYPFHSLHINELQLTFNEKEKESLEAIDPETSADNIFDPEERTEEERNQETEIEKTEVVNNSDDKSCEERDNNFDPEEETEERQEEQNQENEIDKAEVVSNSDDESRKETEDHTDRNLDENEKKEESREVVGVERSVEVKDGTVVVGSVEWKEYPAKGKVHGSGETATFDSDDSVNSFQIYVTEKALQRSAEALSRTGITPSVDTEETVRKMAAMKIEHRDRLKTLKLLLERGADPNACRVPMPVLFLAVMASDVEAVRRLLLCGARTDIPLPPQGKGVYPLHVAAALPGSAGPKITELLLHAITDPDARACDQDHIYKTDKSHRDTKDREGGTTALHVACGRDTDYQVTKLFRNISDPNVPLGNGVGSALCALANNNYHLSGNRQKLRRSRHFDAILVDNVEGTAVDYAYYSFNQDTRIATTPYHALNMQEREILRRLTNSTLESASSRTKPEQLSPLFRFCFYCSRSAFVKLTRCSRCHMVFYCSKTCKLKSWEEGHKDTCVRILPKSAQLRSSRRSGERRVRESANAAQKNELKSQKGAKDVLKFKTARRVLDDTYRQKVTKFMKFDQKPRTSKAADLPAKDQPKENYSFI
ncbi:hypothetical protein WMY93_024450 [Mugilogobius chulae]|uniref:MYND-type domain-containing protein n=1 Tax=Mugilogobius chulae TaxID=88201 RepID=A0AAW0NA19_9GOBI